MKKTLQDQYLLIKEGKGHVGVFLTEAKRQFPNIVRNAATFDEAVASLKTKNIISENVISVMPAIMDRPKKESYETAFEAFLAEAKKKNEDEKVKAEEKKVSKPVEEDLEKNFDYSDEKNPDNMIFDQIMMGYYAEMKDPKNADKTMQQLKDIVFKNLAKNQIYYTENAQFGVKDIGYSVDHPGLGEPKEAKGKYKSSGYGDLNESIQPINEEETKLRKVIREMIDTELEEAYQLYNIRPRTSDKKRGERDTPSSPQSQNIPFLVVKKLERRGLKMEDGVIKMPKLLQIQIQERPKQIDFIYDLKLNRATYPKYNALADSANYVTYDTNHYKFKNATLNDDGSITIKQSTPLKESVEKDLMDINKEAEHEVLQAKLDKIDALIDHRRSKLGKLDEDEDMKALTDKKKVKELEKDIKKLEVAHKKVEKMMSKFKGKKSSDKEVIDEDEPIEEDLDVAAEYVEDATERLDAGQKVDSIVDTYSNLGMDQKEDLGNYLNYEAPDDLKSDYVY
jgi:hypothetical protein